MSQQLPVIQTDNPRGLPATYAYRIGQGMVPVDLPPSPDHAPPKTVIVPSAGKTRRGESGITARADAMARWVAHGATASDAFRLAYQAKGKPDIYITRQAVKVQSNPKYRAALAMYCERLERERRQATIGVRDYVTTRLVQESQFAKSDAARVASLRLLGMSEGMFTTVHKTERTLDPKQLESLKAKLDQRLRETLARLGGAIVPVSGTEQVAIEAEILPPEGDGTGTPLIASGSHAQSTDTIPLVQGPLSPTGPSGTGSHQATPLSAEGPASSSGGDGSHTPLDPGYLSEFDGPLVLQGGLKEG